VIQIIDRKQIVIHSEPGSRFNLMPRPDFTGTWKLDLKASDSFDAVLKAQGISAIERKVLSTLQTTHIILQKEDWIQVTIKTPVSTKTQEFILDGSISEIESQRFGCIRGKNFWDDDQMSWVLVAQMVVNKNPIELITTRTLEGLGELMKMKVQVNQANVLPFVANRVFHRLK
jgi:hypothetical protein